ncbi:MAG: bifunctional phosphopantothenoylcysteine decarboxylase/phosphopantothenate--cysteine ligase CoaBC [Desulfobulbaceae bacterium]|nr:bifunctional phosphopantothenoylcysteine decarboxylase/phosphopantothenate--cysteine ligase CoaBC [Desulfobulbaceae bacterium]
MLNGKRILLGVSGSIALYKTADWVRELQRAGAEVTVVMTTAATRFVTPLTFAALSGRRVHSEMFAASDEERIPHITLAREHDLILIGPATAQTIARLAQGLADDLLSTLVLAAKIPVIVCPAMNSNMYLHPATQANIHRLADYGYRLVAPGCGQMACREEGPGRLADWPLVKEAVLAALAVQDLAGRKVLVTAGPTCEPLDPVRYLGNRASGRMGFALALTAKRRGAEVILVSGPTSLPDPPGVTTIRVNTASEMALAVYSRAEECAAVIKAAAVSDFRPANFSPEKVKKSGTAPQLELAANPDILKTLGERKGRQAKLPILVGFAAESNACLDEGWRKLADKNLDLLAFNDITATGAGFATETNLITILDRDGSQEKLPLLAKEEVADLIWSRVVKLLNR